jgi:hypothetical protein
MRYFRLQMSKPELLNEQQLLERIPGLTSRQLKRLRLSRRIPFYAASYRLRLYDFEAVIRALKRTELLEIGGRN